jgi:DNA-binding NtrC family response regulator
VKKPPGIEAATRNATVLSVGTDPVDAVSLERIFHTSGWRAYNNTEWTLITRVTLTSAFSALREMPIPIVLCDCDLMLGTWRDMLDYISALPDPPLLIVTSRPADERLWAEAPNLGAYDVLAKPFDATEVIRILSLAWQHWQERDGVYRSRTRQRTAAAGTSPDSTVEGSFLWKQLC